MPRLFLMFALLVLAMPADARERPRRPAAPALIDSLPGTERIAIEAGGRTRHYLLHVPRGASGARPVVLVFHASGGQGAQVERQSRFSALGDEASFIAAYPEGEDGQWQVLRDPRSEIIFARLVIEDIARRTPIDRGRIYAGGLSSGAVMAAALGCFAPDLVAGVGLVAGEYVSPCRNTPRAPAILFNGTAEPSPASATRRTSVPARALVPARGYAEAWGSGTGCHAGAEALPARAGAPPERFACGGAQAVFWPIPGAAAGWPGGPGGPPAPDATREIWRFFAALR
ncbi:PHB depolymerase family esterase [Roseomonas sp. CAU 1739]|uniref:alpha/beta hydrolase family esterase n=1 Tax=Roseomonas sp. CAU 1739 TaxID=3140364 RepID=UPI00325AB059